MSPTSQPRVPALSSPQPNSSTSLNSQPAKNSAPPAAARSPAAPPPPPAAASSSASPLVASAADDNELSLLDAPPKLPPKPRHLSGGHQSLPLTRMGPSTQAQGELVQTASAGRPSRLGPLPI